MSATFWPVKRLDTVATIITGNTPPTSKQSNYGGKHLFVGPGDIGSRRVILTAGKTLSDRGFAISRHIPAGATLFVCIGSTIGKIGIAGQDLATNQQINALVAGDELDARYLYWAATTLSKLVREQAGEQAVPLVSKSHFGKFEIAVPTLSEQRAIANAIDGADNFIESIERLIAKKRYLKQGMMQELLTGHTRLPGYSSEWTDATISSLARVTAGGTPSTRVASYWGGGIPWFTPAEIKEEGSGLVSSSNRTISSEGLANSSANLLPSGSVLVTSRASIGNCAVAEVPVTTNQGFASIIPNDGRSTWFLYFWIQQNMKELESRSAGSTFLEISASKVSLIPLRSPGLDEQEAIGQVLRDTDIQLDALNHRLEAARAIKQGMMQELLTGRTRLPAVEVAV